MRDKHRCRLCLKVGHNVRTCIWLKAGLMPAEIDYGPGTPDDKNSVEFCLHLAGLQEMGMKLKHIAEYHNMSITAVHGRISKC